MIKQDKLGYRFSVEPFLLVDFANVYPKSKLIDVGTGSGIIPVLMCQKYSDLKIVAIEIQQSLSNLALENFQSSGLMSFIKLIYGDFLKVAKKIESLSFDLIISNPPYGKLNGGRVNPSPFKALARHEIKLNLLNLVETSFRLLKPNGRIILSYPIYRKFEVLQVLNILKLVPTRLRSVYGRPGAIAKFFLVEAVKSGTNSSTKEDSIYICKQDGSYSENMEKIYASFDYTNRSHRLRKKCDRSRACG